MNSDLPKLPLEDLSASEVFHLLTNLLVKAEVTLSAHDYEIIRKWGKEYYATPEYTLHITTYLKIVDELEVLTAQGIV